MVGMRYTGQRRDRLVKRAIVKGAPLVQGASVSRLDMGRIITIENDYIQQPSWANTIANNIVSRYGQDEREIELWSVYLPSVKMLDTMQVTEPLCGLSSALYLVNYINRNVLEFKEQHKLTSNLAK